MNTRGEDIVAALGRLKPGSGNPLPAVTAAVAIINDATPEFALMKRTPAIRSAAKKADKALAVLQELFQPRIPPDLYNCRRWLTPWKDVQGPDPRSNNVHWICAHQAFELVDKFSRARAVTTEAGNVHIVARLLFEVATGEASSDAGLLRAVRKVKKWREHIPD